MNRSRLELDLGGIEQDRVMEAGVSHVPQHLELTENAIIWSGPFKEVRPGPGMLKDFVELENGSDERIFHYACRWGVLGICKHNIPASHTNYPGSAIHGVKDCWPLPSEKGEFWHTDPLEHWRFFSRVLRAMRDLGAQVNQGKVGDRTDWHCIEVIDRNNPPWKNVRQARMVLSWKLKDYLDIGQVSPDMKWNNKKQQWQIEMGAHSVPNLFGLLSLSLMLSVCRRELVICSACQKPYVPPRRPNLSRRSYCEKCGNKAAQRDAARAYRLRLKQK